MLEPSQIEFYREQGYLLVEDVIEASLLARLREAAEAMIERSRTVRESDAVFDLDEGHSARSVKRSRCACCHRGRSSATGRRFTAEVAWCR